MDAALRALGTWSQSIWAKDGSFWGSAHVDGSHRLERRKALGQCRYASSTSRPMATLGSLPCMPSRERISLSRMMEAFPLTRSVSPRPGTRKIIPMCGFSRMLVSPSVRLLPGRSGTTRWVSSSTSTKPGASPLGETSHRPAAFDVASSTKGEAAMNARECSSRDEWHLRTARSFGSPNSARSSCFDFTTSLYMSPPPFGSIACRLHDRGHAAVEVDRGAADEGGALGDQEGHEVAELLGFADAADGHALSDVFVEGVEVALRAALPLAALDQPDADGVHEDLVGGVFLGQGFRQVDPGRARDAGRQAAGGRRLGAQVGDVDDAPAATLLHVRDREAAETDRRQQLELEVVHPRVVVDRFKRRGGGGAGVVDEDVHPAPFAHDLADEFLDLVGLGHVDWARQHLPARLAYALRRALEHVCAPGADGHARPFGGQPLGGRAPEPFAAARDDGHLAAESEIEHQGLLEERLPRVRGL